MCFCFGRMDEGFPLGSAQGTFLDLCSGVTSGSARGNICSARNWTGVSCLQNKCLTHSIISLVPSTEPLDPFLTLGLCLSPHSEKCFLNWECSCETRSQSQMRGKDKGKCLVPRDNRVIQNLALPMVLLSKFHKEAHDSMKPLIGTFLSFYHRLTVCIPPFTLDKFQAPAWNQRELGTSLPFT